MDIESVLGIAASAIAIGGFALSGYNKFKKKDVSALFNKLADKSLTVKQQRSILRKMNCFLIASGKQISNEYISRFTTADKPNKSYIFHDICMKNNIEPTQELCRRLLGYDEPSFRVKWHQAQSEESIVDVANKPHEAQTDTNIEPVASDNGTQKRNGKQVVYMSDLLQKRYPKACKRLTDILSRHKVEYRFLKETNDIWCRDYMPVQTQSGKLVQFRYEPGYLRGNAEYEASRSDVRRVCEANGIKPVFSDINLDGGNVLICGDRAIVSDKVFSENPEKDKEVLKKELSELLEAEIIIIPTVNGDYTGHADGMVRFVNNTTVLGNDRDIEFKYWKDKMNKVIQEYGLQYLDVPFFYGYKERKHPDHAIGIYVNYLEAGNLIVMPAFGVEGNKDAEALARIKEIFPDKTVETIDYNEVALDGGVLNCTTWTVVEWS